MALSLQLASLGAQRRRELPTAQARLELSADILDVIEVGRIGREIRDCASSLPAASIASCTPGTLWCACSPSRLPLFATLWVARTLGALARLPVFECTKLTLDLVDFFVRTVLEIDQLIPGWFDAAQQFIELEVKRTRVAILGVLNQEYHQERDYGGAGIDDKLPGVGIAEEWPGRGPHNNNSTG